MLEILHIKTSSIASWSLKQHYQSIIAMPVTDMPLAFKAADVMRRRCECPGIIILIEDDMRLGFIMSTNLAYAKTSSDYFAYVAQDAFPGYFWLDYGIKTLETAKAGLLAFNDGRFFGKIAVFGLATRNWLKSIYHNLVFYPEYKSHFADTELSLIAAANGNLAFNPHCLMMEVDYEKHLHGNNQADDALYRRRAASGFDGRIAPFEPAA